MKSSCTTLRLFSDQNGTAVCVVKTCPQNKFFCWRKFFFFVAAFLTAKTYNHEFFRACIVQKRLFPSKSIQLELFLKRDIPHKGFLLLLVLMIEQFAFVQISIEVIQVLKVTFSNLQIANCVFKF